MELGVADGVADGVALGVWLGVWLTVALGVDDGVELGVATQAATVTVPVYNPPGKYVPITVFANPSIIQDDNGTANTGGSAVIM